jgi:hypothetical protein
MLEVPAGDRQNEDRAGPLGRGLDLRQPLPSDNAGRPASPGGRASRSADWLRYAIQQAEEGGLRAAIALAQSIEDLAEVRRQRESGSPVDSIFEVMFAAGGPETRRAAEEAFHQYQHAVMELRALLIRSRIDDSGSTLSEVARVMNISRQKVTELYRVGRSISEISQQMDNKR